MRRYFAAAIAVVALLAPTVAAAEASATPVKHCAHHSTGVCRANSKHPKGVIAKCKDGTWSHSTHFSGACARHKGVRYWYK